MVSLPETTEPVGWFLALLRGKIGRLPNASQLSESNALSPFGGREPSAKVQLSYDRTYVKNVAGANSFDEMQRPGVKGPCAARNLFSIAHPPGKCNPRRGGGAGVQTFVLSFIGSAK